MTTEMFVGILSLITSTLGIGITIGIGIAHKKRPLILPGYKRIVRSNLGK